MRVCTEMTSRQRRVLKICFVTLAISMTVMTVSSVIQLVNNGWDSFSMITVVPFIGMIVSFVILIAIDKKS